MHLSSSQPKFTEHLLLTRHCHRIGIISGPQIRPLPFQELLQVQETDTVKKATVALVDEVLPLLEGHWTSNF